MSSGSAPVLPSGYPWPQSKRCAGQQATKCTERLLLVQVCWCSYMRITQACLQVGADIRVACLDPIKANIFSSLKIFVETILAVAMSRCMKLQLKVSLQELLPPHCSEGCSSCTPAPLLFRLVLRWCVHAPPPPALLQLPPPRPALCFVCLAESRNGKRPDAPATPVTKQ